MLLSVDPGLHVQPEISIRKGMWCNYFCYLNMAVWWNSSPHLPQLTHPPPHCLCLILNDYETVMDKLIALEEFSPFRLGYLQRYIAHLKAGLSADRMNPCSDWIIHPWHLGAVLGGPSVLATIEMRFPLNINVDLKPFQVFRSTMTPLTHSTYNLSLLELNEKTPRQRAKSKLDQIDSQCWYRTMHPNQIPSSTFRWDWILTEQCNITFYFR